MNLNRLVIVMAFLGSGQVPADEDISFLGTANKICEAMNRFAPPLGNKSGITCRHLTVSSAGIVKGTVRVTFGHKWTRPIPLSRSAHVDIDFRYSIPDNQLDMQTRIPLRLSVRYRGRGFSHNFGDIVVDLDVMDELLEADANAILVRIPNPAPELGRIERADDYARIRREYEQYHGRDNVYFASKRFVNWADAQRIAGWVGATVVGGPGL